MVVPYPLRGSHRPRGWLYLPIAGSYPASGSMRTGIIYDFRVDGVEGRCGGINPSGHGIHSHARYRTAIALARP